MITLTPETLKQITTLGPYALSKLLAIGGYDENSFISAKFLGMNNANEFCYGVEFHDSIEGNIQKGKVYVRYDHVAKRFSADY